jgi:hypothetical protein
MTKDEALKLALDDLMVEYDMERTSFAKRVDEIFKQALAAQQEHEPENEPYVSLASVQELQRYSPNGEGGMEVDSLGAYVKLQDVTTPPAAQRPWVGLTDEEIKDVAASCMWWVREQDILDDAIEFAKAYEAKLRSKNA